MLLCRSVRDNYRKIKTALCLANDLRQQVCYGDKSAQEAAMSLKTYLSCFFSPPTAGRQIDDKQASNNSQFLLLKQELGQNMFTDLQSKCVLLDLCSDLGLEIFFAVVTPAACFHVLLIIADNLAVLSNTQYVQCCLFQHQGQHFCLHTDTFKKVLGRCLVTVYTSFCYQG